MASNPDEEVNGAFELLPQFSYCKKRKKKRKKKKKHLKKKKLFEKKRDISFQDE